MVSQKFYKINSLNVFVPRDILDFYFSERRLPEKLHYDPTTYEAETFKTDVPPTEEERIKGSSVFKRYITRNLPWKRTR